MKFLNYPKERQIITITCCFWIISKFLSYKLWLSDRIFPLIPAFDFLENIPNQIHIILLVSSILGILLIAVFPKNNFLILCTIIIEFITYLLDQNRWQPYEYQYFLTLILFYFYRNKSKNFVNYFSLLLIVIYFQSGLHKISGSFLFSIWEKIILQDFFKFKQEQINSLWIHYSGLILAFIEVVLPLVILFTKFKKQAAVGLIVMHLFILVMLSPIGLNMNSVVWPWNIAMIFFLYFVFIYKNDNEIIITLDLIKGNGIIFFIPIVLLPFLNYFVKFDNFLSFNLYSGSVPVLEICINDKKCYEKYKPFLSTYNRFCDSKNVINIKEWSLQEMNIIAIPEERFYYKLIEHWKKNNPNCEVTFIIYKYPYTEQNVKYIK